jgi:hypothetical protein
MQYAGWRRSAGRSYTAPAIDDKFTSKTDGSGAIACHFACHKLKEFATRCVKRQLTTQLGFITGIPIREHRTALRGGQPFTYDFSETEGD